MRKRKYLHALAVAGALGLGGGLSIGLLGAGSPAHAAHPAYDAGTCPDCPVNGEIQLKDASGNALGATSTAPYSPKQTCGVQNATLNCHDYESAWTLAAKTQYNRSGDKVGYDVPYPEHGVSAGYHFQQGRNIDWDDTQRDNYGLADFTSSSGMYGKY